MDVHELPRRALLRTGVRSLAAATAGGLAGCSGLPDPTNPGLFGDVAAPARGPAAYRNLVPERPPFGRPLPFVSRVDVSALDRPWLSPETVATLVSNARGGRDYLGVSREATEAVTRIGFDVTVIRARFSRASVERTLVGSGYERAGEHGGFVVFERPEDDRSAAVGSEVVVWTGPLTAAGYATRVVDAALGQGSRLADADSQFRRVTGTLGTGTSTHVSLAGADAGPADRPLPYRVASGWATTYTPDGAYRTGLFLFEGEPPPVEEVRGQFRNARAGGLLDSYERVEVHRGDRTVRVDALLADDGNGEAGTDDGVGSTDGPRPPVSPRVTFGFDRDPDAGTVTITHEAGDPVLASRLAVETRREPTGGQFADRYVTVSPGDDLTVEPPTDARVLEVTWEPGSPTAVGRFPLSEDGG